MLEPKGRLLLLEALRPPPDYRLDRALATTFTLDLETAMLVPLALAGYTLGDKPNPIEVLDAIRRCAGRLDIFCQAGAISADKWPSDLIGLLENSIHQVPRPRPGFIFHPKCWIVRYEHTEGGEPSYRCLVLSRNLTQDRSWDLILRLDSKDRPDRRNVNEKNQDLSRFIASLPGLAGMADTHPRREGVAGLADELRRVWWDTMDFKSVRFLPFGIPGMRAPSTAEMFAGYRHLVISPFLTPGGLEIACGGVQAESLDVISRGDELDRIGREGLPPAQYWQISSAANLAGAEDAEGRSTAIETDRMLGDLHAKLFVVEWNRLAKIFIGSANATEAAFRGNVELLCELTGGATRYGVDAILGEKEGLQKILEDYTPSEQPVADPIQDLSRAVEGYLFDLAGMPIEVRVSAAGEAWNMSISSSQALPLPKGFEAVLSISPLNRLDPRSLKAGSPIKAVYEGVAAAGITAFFVISCAAEGDGQRVEKQTVVCAALIGGPPDRHDDILVRQIDSPEKFLQFLALLLGHEGPPILADGQTDTGDGKWASFASGGGLLESVARALAGNPDALDGMSKIVDRIIASEQGSSIIPPGWEELWRAVTGARKKIRAR